MDAQSSGTLQSPSETESKTGSSGKSSGLSIDLDRDVDLTKDNAASPIDLECHIQEERITKILDETIYKIKLSIVLPDLVQDVNYLNSILTVVHMDDLLFIFEQYDNPLFSISLMNMAAMEDLKMGDVSLKNRLNPELGHLIYFMNSYTALKPTVEKMISAMKWQYNRQSEGREANPSLEFLYAFERFRDHMVHKMATTAAEELSKKIQTRKLETSNESLIAKIEDITERLKEENERFEKTMASRTSSIAKFEQELTFLNHAAGIRLKKQILDSDRQMVLASRAHAVKNEMLKEEEVETREGYEHLLHTHLIDEKNQRARRFKVETQLLSWLQKYDTEMIDKQAELDDYIEKYEEEEKKCEKLEVKLQEQDKEYIPLMAEREAEYHQEMTEKMNAFLLEHAARVIQQAWRVVLANRVEKKKLKKLVQKMKEAKEKAERRAEAEARAAEKAAKKAKKKGK